MSQELGAFTPVKFSLKLVEVLYNETIYRMVTNTKYEGEIKASGDTVTVRTAGRINLSAYTKGMNLDTQDLNPTQEDLKIDQQFYFKFVVDDVDKIQNDIDAMTEYAQNAKSNMEELLDSDILTYARKNIKGENVLGTSYSTGTVAVAATTGAVTGTSTVVSADMVGGYFKAVGHTTFYLVTARASNTSFTITDLSGTGYTGGAISAGASYEIKAATAVSLTKANVYSYMVELDTKMTQALTPKADRFIVVNAAFEGILRQAPEFIPAVETAYNEVVKNGRIGKIANLNVYCSELVNGDNTNGYWFWAGTKEYLAFAAQIMETAVVPSNLDPNSFVSTCKGLLVWGRKVFEGNRGRASVIRATIA